MTQYRVPRRRLSECDCVALFLLPIAPTIEDDQCYRTRRIAGHICPLGVRVYVRNRLSQIYALKKAPSRMRFTLCFALIVTATAASAQDGAPHVATKPTVVRAAPSAGNVESPSVGQIAKGATVEVTARDKDWVRVRLEGWVRDADLVVADSTLRQLTAADIRANPAAAQGKLVRWDVEAVALQIADQLRVGLQTGEQYLLALGPGVEKTLVYIVVPPALLTTARSLPAMARITVTARVRNGRSEPAGVPILDLQSLTRR